MRKFRLKTITALPTISQGQFDDLKVETKNTRIWLSRMTIEDGMPYNNQVTEEKLLLQPKQTASGHRWGVDSNLPTTWQIVRQYEAK